MNTYGEYDKAAFERVAEERARRELVRKAKKRELFNFALTIYNSETVGLYKEFNKKEFIYEIYFCDRLLSKFTEYKKAA